MIGFGFPFFDFEDYDNFERNNEMETMNQNIPIISFTTVYDLKDACKCHILKFPIKYATVQKITSDGKYNAVGIVNVYIFDDILGIHYFENIVGEDPFEVKTTETKLNRVLSLADYMNKGRKTAPVLKELSELLVEIAAPLILEKLKILVGSSILEIVGNDKEFENTIHIYTNEQGFNIRIHPTDDMIFVIYEEKRNKINVYSLMDINKIFLNKNSSKNAPISKSFENWIDVKVKKSRKKKNSKSNKNQFDKFELMSYEPTEDDDEDDDLLV